jgi:hypothetical protein
MSKDMKMIYRLLALFGVLVVIVAVLPSVKQMFAPMFPEGFQDLTCRPNPCGEGEFCQAGAEPGTTKCYKRDDRTDGYNVEPEGYFN